MSELIDLITSNFDYENFFSAKLTAPMTASDTDVFMDAIPTPSEGVLVIDWDVAASREVIFYNSKTASKVTCPSVSERGFDDSTATTHASGANVIMAPVRAWFRLAQQLATTSEQGWKPLGYTPNTITDNGNRNYTLVFNSVDLTSFISNKMRFKTTRTTSAPTQCASLNGTNHYFNKTSPAGMTFTDDFAAGGWVKPSSSAVGTIISRYNGTSGWQLRLGALGQADTRVQLTGFNASSANYSTVYSVQGVPINRWSHVAAQLDMSTFTATTTTSYVMIDGQNVPAIVARGGTNPTALVQAGNLEVGVSNAIEYFGGKLAQVWVSSAKVTQAGVLIIKNQGLTSALCSTYSIISAYSFNNSINDINTTNANNLTAQNSATATNADSPFAQDDSGVPTATTDLALVESCTFSTNTTVVVQVPEGCTLPTDSTIASIDYSTNYAPFGWTNDKSRWAVSWVCRISVIKATPVAGTFYSGTTNNGEWAFTLPIGAWDLGYQANISSINATAVPAPQISLSTSNSSVSDTEFSLRLANPVTGAGSLDGLAARSKPVAVSAATPYYFVLASITASATQISINGTVAATVINAIPAGI